MGSKAAGADIEMYAIPNVDYQISDTLVANVGFEMDARHSVGQPLNVLDSAGTYLDVGVSWDITPNLNINPFIDMKPTRRFALDTTTFNAVLSLKLL
jgi:hypothetical protein